MFPWCSVWTIDLAYLLRRCGLQVTLVTLTFGVDPSFADVAYYSVSQIGHRSTAQTCAVLSQSVPPHTTRSLTSHPSVRPHSPSHHSLTDAPFSVPPPSPFLQKALREDMARVARRFLHAPCLGIRLMVSPR